MRGQYNNNGLGRKTLSLPRLGTQETLWNKGIQDRPRRRDDLPES